MSIPVPRSSDERLRLFIESVRDYAFILMDTQNRVTEWNIGAERILGYTEEEVLGQSAEVFFTPEDRAAGEPAREMETSLREGRAEDDRWHMRKDGSRFRASGVMTVMRDTSGAAIGFAKVMRDVSEREESREKLECTLREQAVLLREIHHRVKNNLQVIVSLISLQASHLTDGNVLGMFEETQNRVRAIASIHERLYSTDDFSTIHFGMHLEQLTRQLAAFYGVGERIKVDIDVADLAVDIEQAVPLALISNELLCNAYKHAFPVGSSGHLLVALRYVGSEAGTLTGELEVTDDGTGLPSQVDFKTAKSTGFQLVNILARQLRATPELTGREGTSFRMRFPISDE